MINVTYAITVCNELEEITNLINFLHPRIHSDDEILIQYDEDSASSPVTFSASGVFMAGVSFKTR